MKANAFAKRIGRVLLNFGFDPRRMIYSIADVPYYFVSLARLSRKENRRENWPISVRPALADRRMSAGVAKGHYFHQDLWAARRIFQINPKDHIDVGSRVDGFIAHLLVFRGVTVIDVRDLKSCVTGLSFMKADVLEARALTGLTADSISSLHALEHFGLGRYGDPIDVDGWKHGIANLAAVLKRGGTFLLALPIGRQRIDFNSHRVFSPHTVIAECARNGLELHEFSYIDDDGEFHPSCGVTDGGNLEYGCGCFEFNKY